MYSIQEVEELMGLAPEKVLLKWMNFHLKKSGYNKQVTNFSSDLKVRRFVILYSLFSLPIKFIDLIFVWNFVTWWNEV